MNEPHYPERRAQPALTEDRVALMIEESISESMTRHEARMVALIKNEFNTLGDKFTQDFKNAFPGGDPHGHRIAHEKQIKDATRWDALKADFISKAFTTGLMAALFFVLAAAWESVKSEVKK